MKILVIAPHMDDEVLGVGGAISKYVADGHEVHVCIIANRAYDHKYNKEKIAKEMQCTMNAKAILGYKKVEFFGMDDELLDKDIQGILVLLESYLNKFNPDIVYTCHGGDNNQDHKAVFQASMIALRPCANKNIQKVLCYEVPSSTDQSPQLIQFAFLPNCYLNIEKYLQNKIKALTCYATELRPFPHPRSQKGLEIVALKRGSEIGCNVAEAYMLLREKLG